MAINLGAAQTQSLANQGAITTGVALGGDLGGNLPNASVTALQGQALQAVGFAAGLGYRHNGTSFVLTSLLDENTNFGGDVSGTQATTFRVTGIDGVGVEAPSPVAGQVLKYSGSVWQPAPDTGGFSLVFVSSATTADDRQYIVCNSTSAAFTVTCPASPATGDYFRVIDGQESFGTNAVTVVPSGADTINGDTSIIIDVNNAVIDFLFTGVEWKYFIISLRA